MQSLTFHTTTYSYAFFISKTAKVSLFQTTNTRRSKSQGKTITKLRYFVIYYSKYICSPCFTIDIYCYKSIISKRNDTSVNCNIDEYITVVTYVSYMGFITLEIYLPQGGKFWKEETSSIYFIFVLKIHNQIPFCISKNAEM